MKRSRFCYRRRRARTAVLLFAGAMATFGAADARELLPFPSQQMQSQSQVQQSAPPPQGSNVDSFARSIISMDCGQLRSLRARLVVTQQNASTSADKSYFSTLITTVEQRRTAQRCPAV